MMASPPTAARPRGAGGELPAFLRSRISRPCRTRSWRSPHRAPDHRPDAWPSPTTPASHPPATTPRICDYPRCRVLTGHTQTRTRRCALCARRRDAAA